MNTQEKQNFTSLLNSIKERSQAISTARKKAQRKAILLQDHCFDDSQRVYLELQEQLKQTAQLDYLLQTMSDYLSGEITLDQLTTLVKDERVKTLILN